MKVNFDVNVKNLSGKDMLIQTSPDTVVTLSLKDVVTTSLTNSEEKGEGEKKFTAWKLAKRIEENPKEVKVSIEELSIIKTAVADNYKAAVSGWVWDYLENGGKDDNT